MAYSTGKKTIVLFHGADKNVCLNGFWSEDAIRRYAERRSFKGKITVRQWVLNYSKYDLDRLENMYEIEVV